MNQRLGHVCAALPSLLGRPNAVHNFLLQLGSHWAGYRMPCRIEGAIARIIMGEIDDQAP